MSDYIRRIGILGKTGVGKSSIANILTESQIFTVSMNAKSVTQKCQCVNMGNTLVCDTPGLFDTDRPFSKIALEIQESLKYCHQPHAFLITFRPERMTSENVLIIDMIRVIFGEEVFKHAIVVFTHGAEFESDGDLIAYYNGCKEIEELIDKCEGRVIVVEKSDSNKSRKKILDVVDGLSKNGHCSYTYEHIELHKRSLQAYIDTHPDPTDTVKEVKYVLEGIVKSLEEDRKMKEQQKEEERKLKERQMEEERKQREEERKQRELERKQREEERKLKERQMEEERKQREEERKQREEERKQREEERKLKERQMEEERKQMEEERKLKERQMEEERKLKERQMEEERKLKERQMEEERKQREEERKQEERKMEATTSLDTGLMATSYALDAVSQIALHTKTPIGFAAAAAVMVTSGILKTVAHVERKGN